MEGIQAVCAMADDPATFENLSAVELLQMANVVGVPASATIGDYPDPMTYRLAHLCPGQHVSIADLTVMESMGSDGVGIVFTFCRIITGYC